MENLIFYGWHTQSKTKIIALVRWAERQPKDTLIRQLMNRLSQAHVQLISNPFYQAGFESERLARVLDEIKVSL